LDESGWGDLGKHLKLPDQLRVTAPNVLADFWVDEGSGGTDLAAALDALPMKYEY
jgi:hypothetical protein